MRPKRSLGRFAGKRPAARERRWCWRIPWLTHVTVSVAGPDGLEPCAEDTTTQDASLIDLSFRWRRPIEPGTVILVRFESLPKRPELAATVRHCTHVGGTHFHVGVELIDNYDARDLAKR